MSLSEYPSNNFSKTLKLLECENETIGSQDAEEFSNRIKTFVDKQKWVGKPSSLAPPICARYGWKCVAPNLLQCVSCSATLCTSLPPMEKCDTYKKCLVEIIKSLKSSHKKHCPWPLAPSPDSHFKMVSIHKRVAFQEFLSRLESLLSIKSSLPLIKQEIVEVIGISNDYLESLHKLSLIPKSKNCKSAVLLAATGWKRRPDASERNFIVCYHCQRTVGLWFYVPLAIDSEGKNSEVHMTENVSDGKPQSTLSSNVSDCVLKNGDTKGLDSETLPITLSSESESPNPQIEAHHTVENDAINDLSPAKRLKIKVESKEMFDPLYEHRPWCLWVSETDDISVNSSSKSIPGWKIYIKSLLKNVESDILSPCEFHSPSKEELNSARELVKTWNSPS